MSNLNRLVVLRKSVHRLPIEQYAECLRQRLPDLEVQLARTPEQEENYVQDADVVTGMELSADLLDHAQSLRWFACSFAGTDHLPMEELERRGVAVTNASGVHGPNIGEHVVGSILVFSRRFHKAFRLNQSHQWRHFQGYELQGSTVTVVGLGAIGTAICERLESFNVRRVGIRHSPEKGGPVEEVHGYDTPGFHDALGRSDYVVLACPLTELTDQLINRETLITMPTDAVLVNVARGGVIDTEALVKGLQKGELRGAALDVTDPEPLPGDHPLWTMDNVMITPHNAGNTPNYFDRLADIIKRNVESIRETGSYDNLENQVI